MAITRTAGSTAFMAFAYAVGGHLRGNLQLQQAIGEGAAQRLR